MKTVVFFAPHLTHFIETIVWSISLDDEYRTLVLTRSDSPTQGGEHPGSVQRLEDNPRVTVAEVDVAEPVASDLLVFGMARSQPFHPRLPGWIEKAAATACHPHANRYGSRLDWLRELIRSFPYYLSSRKIYERSAHWGDFRFGGGAALRYTPFPHPQFLADPEWKSRMFQQPNLNPRPFRIGFIGNREPAERGARLNQVQTALQQQGAQFVQDPNERPLNGAPVFWLEYGIGGSSRGLNPSEYPATLSMFDFCISPPGWELNWAHRTIEALIRGTIPVIDDPELYNLELEDGVNCVIADPRDWSGATRRCLQMRPEEIARMRKNVLQLRERRLLPEIAAARIRRDLLAGI